APKGRAVGSPACGGPDRRRPARAGARGGAGFLTVTAGRRAGAYRSGRRGPSLWSSPKRRNSWGTKTGRSGSLKADTNQWLALGAVPPAWCEFATTDV